MLYNRTLIERELYVDFTIPARCKVVVVVSSNIHLEQFLYLD